MLGPGLIGGSVLRAVRSDLPGVRLQSWARREAVREQLRADEARIDLVADDLNEAVSGADLIVLAMPTGVMAEVVSKIDSDQLSPEALVTDVGSVKAPVMDEVGPLVRGKGAAFIGSHPMAGSEKVGLSHARADLFRRASVIVTPEDGAQLVKDERCGRLIQFWRRLGGQVFLRDAATHDRLVAAISHLPHLVAAALVRSVLSGGDDVGAFCGGGFRDTTRVAGGPEEMWSGILADNRASISEQLGSFIVELELWKEALDTLDREQLRGFLSEARSLRERLSINSTINQSDGRSSC